MKELLRTNDPVELSFVQALLKDSGIETIVFDQHTSIMEGSIGAIPRRIMVSAIAGRIWKLQRWNCSRLSLPWLNGMSQKTGRQTSLSPVAICSPGRLLSRRRVLTW